MIIRTLDTRLLAKGKNSSFKQLSVTTAGKRWDSRRDTHPDYLDLRPLSRSASTAVEEIQSRRVVGRV